MDGVFVYGTLCHGQKRQHQWPVVPIAILPAWIHGTLHGAPWYPALKTGTDCVAGQCWLYGDSDIQTVLTRLDQIEVTNQPGVANEYDRVRVPVHRRQFALDDAHPAPTSPALDAESDRQCRGFDLTNAWTYRFHREPTDEGFRRIRGVPVSLLKRPSDQSHSKMEVVWWMPSRRPVGFPDHRLVRRSTDRPGNRLE